MNGPVTTDTPLGRVSDGTEVIAASRVTGRQLLTTVDAFVDNQSRFDRQARVNLEYGVLAVSRDVYLDYVSSQVMDWSSAETGKLKKIVASIATNFPHSISPSRRRFFSSRPAAWKRALPHTPD